MRKISSGMTFLFRYVFPILYFGILGTAGTVTLLDRTVQDRSEAMFAFVVMAAAGLAVIRFVIWDLADEVLDASEFLLVKKWGHVERIAIYDIERVDLMQRMTPQRIELRLKRPCRFGRMIAFLPDRSLSAPLEENEVAAELIYRVEQARKLSG